MLKLIILLCCVLSIWARSKNSNERIVGGYVALEGQFPFAAAIYTTNSEGTFFCSGTLLNENWIVTAAQCIIGAISSTIRLGSNSYQSGGKQVTSQKFVVHPHFDISTLVNDIGLLKLQSPIEFNDNIQPIDFLPEWEIAPGSNTMTFGWGQIIEVGLSDKLRYAFGVALTTDECQKTYGNWITENMVCFARNNMQGPCKGDSGSPLLQYGDGAASFLVGVSSFISAQGCKNSDPAGFTRVFPYVSWINDVVTNDS